MAPTNEYSIPTKGVFGYMNSSINSLSACSPPRYHVLKTKQPALKSTLSSQNKRMQQRTAKPPQPKSAGDNSPRSIQDLQMNGTPTESPSKRGLPSPSSVSPLGRRRSLKTELFHTRQGDKSETIKSEEYSPGSMGSPSASPPSPPLEEQEKKHSPLQSSSPRLRRGRSTTKRSGDRKGNNDAGLSKPTNYEPPTDKGRNAKGSGEGRSTGNQAAKSSAATKTSNPQPSATAQPNKTSGTAQNGNITPNGNTQKVPVTSKDGPPKIDQTGIFSALNFFCNSMSCGPNDIYDTKCLPKKGLEEKLKVIRDRQRKEAKAAVRKKKETTKTKPDTVLERKAGDVLKKPKNAAGKKSTKKKPDPAVLTKPKSESHPSATPPGTKTSVEKQGKAPLPNTPPTVQVSRNQLDMTSHDPIYKIRDKKKPHSKKAQESTIADATTADATFSTLEAFPLLNNLSGTWAGRRLNEYLDLVEQVFNVEKSTSANNTVDPQQTTANSTETTAAGIDSTTNNTASPEGGEPDPADTLQLDGSLRDWWYYDPSLRETMSVDEVDKWTLKINESTASSLTGFDEDEPQRGTGGDSGGGSGQKFLVLKNENGVQKTEMVELPDFAEAVSNVKQRRKNATRSPRGKGEQHGPCEETSNYFSCDSSMADELANAKQKREQEALASTSSPNNNNSSIQSGSPEALANAKQQAVTRTCGAPSPQQAELSVEEPGTDIEQHPVKISIVRTLDEPVKGTRNSSSDPAIVKDSEHYRKKSREFSREDSLEETLDTPVPRHASLDACNSNILRVG